MLAFSDTQSVLVRNTECKQNVCLLGGGGHCELELRGWCVNSLVCLFVCLGWMCLCLSVTEPHTAVQAPQGVGSILKVYVQKLKMVCTRKKIRLRKTNLPYYKSQSTWKCVPIDHPHVQPTPHPHSTINSQCKAPHEYWCISPDYNWKEDGKNAKHFVCELDDRKQ